MSCGTLTERQKELVPTKISRIAYALLKKIAEHDGISIADALNAQLTVDESIVTYSELVKECDELQEQGR